MLRHKSSSSPGLTTVELIIAIGIATLILVSLISLLTHIFSTRTHTIQQIALTKQAQDAVDTIARDLRYTNRLLKTSNVPDPDVSWSPIGEWNFNGQSESSRQLLLEVPATTKSYHSPDNSLVFEQTTPDCASLAPYIMTNVVYFVKDANLYRRTIIPQGVTACPEPIFQKQSCHNPTAAPECKESDILIASDVTNFSVQYYEQPFDADPINAYDTTLPADFLDTTKTARISLTIKKPNAPHLKESKTSVLLSKGVM